MEDKPKGSVLSRVFRFYYEGFKNMKEGRTLWAIILIKLFIMFAVLKVFFFPNILKKNFSTDKERSEYVIEQLTTPTK
jgi:hypothetical protein